MILVNNRHYLYFIIAIIAIFAVSGVITLEISNAMTDLILLEGSFYSVIRNGEARLSAEINYNIQNIDLGNLENNFNEIDENFNAL